MRDTPIGWLTNFQLTSCLSCCMYVGHSYNSCNSQSCTLHRLCIFHFLSSTIQRIRLCQNRATPILIQPYYFFLLPFCFLQFYPFTFLPLLYCVPLFVFSRQRSDFHFKVGSCVVVIHELLSVPLSYQCKSRRDGIIALFQTGERDVCNGIVASV